jgi:NDP-sugar pyrophosphorylase family protein
MKAMILAAGKGTRLRPLTLTRPKALMPIANRPVIKGIIEYLKKHGVTEIVVNAHHLSDHIVKYLGGGKPFGVKIEVKFEPEILGTGGGIKNTSGFWGTEPFLVINSDIITDLDLTHAINAHTQMGNIVTLVLHDYEPYNKIKVDEDLKIVEIPYNCRPDRLAFTGIHIISPELLGFIPEGGYSDIIECYRQLIRSENQIGAYVANDFYWMDIGTIEDYMRANKEALKGSSFLVPENCTIDNRVTLEDWVVIGDNCLLEEGADVRRSILWDKVEVKRGVKIIDSVITSSKKVTSDIVSGVL